MRQNHDITARERGKCTLPELPEVPEMFELNMNIELQVLYFLPLWIKDW